MHETHGKYRHWLVQVINQIRNIYPKIKIVIRPHLRTKEGNYKQLEGYVQGVEISKTWEDRTYFEGGEGLKKDLNGARFVVSYNSNVLTQAVLQGIPSVCYDIRSMAAPVCLRPDQMNNLKYVNSWIKNLENKPEQVIKAINKSTKAIEHLDSLQTTEEKKEVA